MYFMKVHLVLSMSDVSKFAPKSKKEVQPLELEPPLDEDESDEDEDLEYFSLWDDEMLFN